MDIANQFLLLCERT